jgi:hypothetical protein
MSGNPGKAKDFARIALALIRMFNGAAALFAPAWLIRRLGVDPDKSPTTFYAFRMFGIRTLLVGAELLSKDEESRRHALRGAVLIHASDTVSATIAALHRQVTGRAALTTILISAVNTALAVIAQPRKS